MKTKIKNILPNLTIAIFTLSLFLLNGCSQNSELSNSSPNTETLSTKDSKLPDKMPNDITFLLERKSFVSGSEVEIFIKNDVVYCKQSINGVKKSWEKEITKQQLDNLYQSFVYFQFDQMEFKSPPNGAVSEAYQLIRVVIDSKIVYEVKNTGIEIATDKDKAGFLKIAEKLEKLAQKEND